MQNTGVLQAKTAEDIDKTYDLTIRRLDKLVSSDGIDAADEAILNTSIAFQSLSAQQNRSAEIQVKTREGDIITINFNQSSSSSQTALKLQQGDSSIQAFQKSADQSSAFSISIEGELNPDEQKALQKLLKKMHKVSNAFFQGNNKTALKHALKLGFNDKQLASFSINLSQQKSFQAVTAYQQTAMPEQKINSNLLSQAGEFMAQAKTLLQGAESALQSFAEPQQSFNELFSSIGLLTRQDSPEEDDIEDQTAFSRIVNQLGQDAFAGELRQAG